MPLDSQTVPDADQGSTSDEVQTLDAAQDYHYATFDFGSSRGITPRGLSAVSCGADRAYRHTNLRSWRDPG